jgi:hypothetical protein
MALTPRPGAALSRRQLDDIERKVQGMAKPAPAPARTMTSDSGVERDFREAEGAR